jgi:hypothetical protein
VLIEKFLVPDGFRKEKPRKDVMLAVFLVVAGRALLAVAA